MNETRLKDISYYDIKAILNTLLTQKVKHSIKLIIAVYFVLILSHYLTKNNYFF